MKKSSLVWIGLAAIAVLALVLILNRKQEQPSAPRDRLSIYNFDQSKCPGPRIQFKVEDPYMRGLIEQGQTVDVTLNAFACQSIQAGDLVLYRFSEFDPPVVRRVVGKSGDHFTVEKDNQLKGWVLNVNNQPIVSVTKQKYVFGGDLPPPLSLAATQRKGALGPSDVILFSSFPPGEKDSGVFGVVALQDIIGVVEKSK